MTIEIPDECEDWIGWLADEFEKLDNTLPELERVFFMDREWPDWVSKMVRELIGTLYPAAKLKVAVKWTPDDLGALIGQRVAYFQRLCEPDPWPGLDLEKLWRRESERSDGVRHSRSMR